MTTSVAEIERREEGGRFIPGSVLRKIDRGRMGMRKNAPQRRLNYKFWQGDTYWYLNAKNALVNQSTVSFLLGGGKPSHRIRNKYPFIAAIVAAKVSAATQRIPSYEVVPTTTDIESAQAAGLAEKVALWGYDKWRLRRITTKAFTHAFVGGEGFVYPYFDSTVGPYVEIEDPETGEARQVGQGQIAHKVLSANEVFWEPGVDFDESRWYCIEQALPLEEVKAMEGFMGDEIVPDATDSDAPTSADTANLVLVTTYFERPSAKRTRGRRIVIANHHRIVPDEDYPCEDHEGNVLDEPVLIRISYTVEVDDRDRSLVEMLIDPQRTIQDCWNKLLEWKNRCLNPQMKAPRGSNLTRTGDEPGAIRWYTSVGGREPEWERPPQVPSELFQMLDLALNHMRALAADVDVQASPDLAARTAAQAIEQAQLRWQSFLGDAAEFHSRLMRRDLYLVQRHFSEPRLIEIQGTFGPDLTHGFRGADLLGQANVRVAPDTLAIKSRKAVIDETLLFADRGWISPQAAMAVIQGGIAENLWKGWIEDVGRANKIIQTIKQGPDALFALPDRPIYPGEEPPVDPTTGQPLLAGPAGQPMVPGYMPRPFDKVPIHKEIFESWMKGSEWDRLPPPMQHAAITYYDTLLRLEARQLAEAAAQQQMQAEEKGMENAAKDVQSKPMPDQRLPNAEIS